MNRLNTIAFALAVSLLLVGCSGKKSFSLVPAKGVVKINGTPAAGIMVQFIPDVAKKNEGPTSQAVSGTDGSFVLFTIPDNQSGAVPGAHVVCLVDTLEERPEQGQESTAKPRISSNLATQSGGLKMEIKAGEDIVIDIK